MTPPFRAWPDYVIHIGYIVNYKPITTVPNQPQLQFIFLFFLHVCFVVCNPRILIRFCLVILSTYQIANTDSNFSIHLYIFFLLFIYFISQINFLFYISLLLDSLANISKSLRWTQPLLFRLRTKEGANKRGNSPRLTQSFHFFMFEPIFSPVNALNQPI